jgi:uncharacterized repeat protein (TIGR02543 family)
MRKMKHLFLVMTGLIVFFGCTNESWVISFETNGGSHIESMTYDQWIENGLPVTLKEGYSLDGWYLDSAFEHKVTEKTLIESSVTLYAKWVVNTYSIIYQTNGGNDMPSSIHDYGSELILAEEPVKSGFEFLGWFTNTELTSALSLTTMPAHNITLYAKWIAVGVTITFDSQGGSDVLPLTGQSGDPLDPPDDPIREGYVFSGWIEDLSDPELYVFHQFPNQPVTLYADWGTTGLEYQFIDNNSAYEVGIGTARNLSSITIPNFHQGKPVTQIMEQGFADAEFMNTLYLPKTLTTIGRLAFINATSLSSITLPDRLSTIGSSAFRHCHSLSEFIVSSNNDYFKVFDGVLFSYDLSTLIKYPQAKIGSHYIVPQHVLIIEEDAFSSTSQLISIDLGAGVTTIKSHAFYQANALASIVIPNQVTTVELYAFRDAYALASVTLGTGITEISAYMFNGCVSLEEITIPYNISFIAYGAFYDCINLKRIYITRTFLDGLILGSLFMFTNTSPTMMIYFVNQATLDAYKVAYHWSSYKTKMQVVS